MDRRKLNSHLASQITSLPAPHPLRVAIDGVDAAGKTTLADELAGALASHDRSAIRASIDGFHNPASVRYRRGSNSPEGYYRDSFNYRALLEELLEPLGPGGSRRYRRAVFDFRTDSHTATAFEEAAPESVLLFDGVFLLRPELSPVWDLSILLLTEPSIALARAETRDLEMFGSSIAIRHRYEQRYLPGQRLYFAEADPVRRADFVIDNNDPTDPELARQPTAGAADSFLTLWRMPRGE
jgi:uridine kinase